VIITVLKNIGTVLWLNSYNLAAGNVLVEMLLIWKTLKGSHHLGGKSKGTITNVDCGKNFFEPIVQSKTDCHIRFHMQCTQ